MILYVRFGEDWKAGKIFEHFHVSGKHACRIKPVSIERTIFIGVLQQSP
jgi:hypothetical protein